MFYPMGWSNYIAASCCTTNGWKGRFLPFLVTLLIFHQRIEYTFKAFTYEVKSRLVRVFCINFLLFRTCLFLIEIWVKGWQRKEWFLSMSATQSATCLLFEALVLPTTILEARETVLVVRRLHLFPCLHQWAGLNKHRKPLFPNLEKRVEIGNFMDKIWRSV